MSVSSGLQDLSLSVKCNFPREMSQSGAKRKIGLGGRRKAGHWVGLEGVNLNATNDESNGRLNDDGEQLRTGRSREGVQENLWTPLAGGSRDEVRANLK